MSILSFKFSSLCKKEEVHAFFFKAAQSLPSELILYSLASKFSSHILLLLFNTDLPQYVLNYDHLFHLIPPLDDKGLKGTETYLNYLESYV